MSKDEDEIPDLGDTPQEGLEAPEEEEVPTEEAAESEPEADSAGAGAEEAEVMAAPVPTRRAARAKPTNNIYSVLVFIAFVSLATTAGVLWYKNLKLTEGDRPSDAGVFKAPFHLLNKK